MEACSFLKRDSSFRVFFLIGFSFIGRRNPNSRLQQQRGGAPEDLSSRKRRGATCLKTGT